MGGIMAIFADDLNWFLEMTGHRRGTILELGSQWLFVFDPPWPGYPPELLHPKTLRDGPIRRPYTAGDGPEGRPYAKQLFLRMGYGHYSVDLNGEGGSMVEDLATAIDWRNIPRPDFITDFGTSEHIFDLWQCLKNVHDMAGVGCLIFHVNPAPGYWPDHCFHYRTADFYEGFATMTGCEIVNIHQRNGNAACCLKVHENKRFPGREEFASLPIYRK